MNGLRLTRRGYFVAGVAWSALMLLLLGTAGWIEGLS